MKREIQALKDPDLLSRTESLALEERRVTAELLEYLAEVSRRKLFSDLGCNSLFQYCTSVLRYSDAAAQRRVEAVRLMNVVPEIKEKVESGDLSLSTVSLAQRFFRQEAKFGEAVPLDQKKEILKSLEGKSSREAERELLSHSSRPERHFQERTRPVSATHSKMELVFSDDQLKLFEKARGLLAHAHPEMNWADLFQKVTEIALQKLDPATKPQRKASPTRKSTDPMQRQAPTGLRRDIWSRDQGRCVKCGSRYALEMDHQTPWALGGETRAENLRLLCRSCNRREAIRAFGIEKVSG